jgi:hypothetical protein
LFLVFVPHGLSSRVGLEVLLVFGGYGREMKEKSSKSRQYKVSENNSLPKIELAENDLDSVQLIYQ